MDRRIRLEMNQRADEFMKQVEQEVEAEWEAGNYSEQIRWPEGISTFRWPLGKYGKLCLI
uniref:Uncharacterized protein n=1 Tax=Anopheles atroparvus TaxID=41427 RepID=A0AAG5D2V3_ANOAO